MRFSLVSLAKDCSPGTERRQNGERPDCSSVGHWVLHAVKAFTSPYLGVLPRNWCWGNRISSYEAEKLSLGDLIVIVIEKQGNKTTYRG